MRARAISRVCPHTIDTGGTIGQMVDGLDAFYADFRNRTVRVPRAARVVAMTINGESAEKIQSAIDLARWAAKEGI